MGKCLIEYPAEEHKTALVFANPPWAFEVSSPTAFLHIRSRSRLIDVTLEDL